MTKVAWIVWKDLVSELRGRRALPITLALGWIVAFFFGIVISRIPGEKRQVVAILYWLAICVAGVAPLGWSFASEREEGCLEGLLLYPVSPGAVYLGKVIVNTMFIGALECVLLPLFCAYSGEWLLARPWHMLGVGGLATVGISAVGTLIGTVASGARHGGLMALLFWPLIIPLVVAAAEATRQLATPDLGPQWWLCIRFLGAFATIFLVAGTTLFEFVTEE